VCRKCALPPQLAVKLSAASATWWAVIDWNGGRSRTRTVDLPNQPPFLRQVQHPAQGLQGTVDVVCTSRKGERINVFRGDVIDPHSGDSCSFQEPPTVTEVVLGFLCEFGILDCDRMLRSGIFLSRRRCSCHGSDIFSRRIARPHVRNVRGSSYCGVNKTWKYRQ